MTDAVPTPTKGNSPTSRSLDVLRREGWLAQVVERWNPHSRTRLDLFGFIDVLAIREGEVLGVQACARASAANRIAKIADHEHVGAVRKAGIRIEVWSWAKNSKGRWTLKREDCS